MKRVEALHRLTDLIGVPVEQRTVYAGSINTSYLSAGSGLPILLLHGSGTGGIIWYPVIGRLSEHFRVIVPDMVGYGESDKPVADYDRQYFCNWLGDLLDCLGIPKANLVGSSHGGAIALQFAHDVPGRVDRIVIADSGVPARGVSLAQLFGMFWMNLVPSSTLSRWLRRYAVVDQNTIDPALGEYEAGVCRMPGGKRAFWRGRGRAGVPLTAQCLEQVQQETLIIWGQEDVFFPAICARGVQAALPHAELHVVPKAGHLPFFDQPDAFVDLIVGFMSKER